MKALASCALVIAMMSLGGAVLAQSPNGLVGGSQFNPPLPAPPPAPSTAVPVVPQMDVPSPQYSGPDYGYNNSPRARSSFHDRILRCLDEAAAAGLRPADRAAYSRACANQ
jgi:hypothetical protein